MKPEPQSFILLRKANPITVDPAAAHTDSAQAAFRRIVMNPRGRQQSRWRRRGRGYGAGAPVRTLAAVGGAGMSLLAVLALVLVFSGSTAAPAFAGWTAQPTAARQAQIALAVRSCGLARPLLTEARGPYVAAVFASKSGGSACIEGPSISVVGSIGGARAANDRLKPGQIGTAVVTGADSDGDGVVLIAGRVGSAVRSVVINRRNHAGVTASVRGGWYLAWWPAGPRATSATVTTTTGARRVALPAAAKVGQLDCGGGSATTSCASVSGSNGPGTAGVPGLPLIGSPVGKPFDHILLLIVWNASSVLVCFHPPGGVPAALQPNGQTGPCRAASLLTRVPQSFPVQKNLLEVLPKAVWKVTVPAGIPKSQLLRFLVIASGAGKYPAARTGLTVNR